SCFWRAEGRTGASKPCSSSALSMTTATISSSLSLDPPCTPSDGRRSHAPLGNPKPLSLLDPAAVCRAARNRSERSCGGRRVGHALGSAAAAHPGIDRGTGGQGGGRRHHHRDGIEPRLWRYGRRTAAPHPNRVRALHRLCRHLVLPVVLRLRRRRPHQLTRDTQQQCSASLFPYGGLRWRYTAH